MKKIIIYILLLPIFISCDDWLEVKPSGSIIDEELYEKESGYKQALAGIYITMAKPDLYGQELLVGIPDAIAQYWKTDLSSNVYYDISNFNYTTKTGEAQLLGIWRRMYTAIANLNILIEKLDEAEAEKLSDYKLIRGEALGLRAYLHLDLLRLYGPVLKNGGMEELSIPYRTKNINKIVKRMTSNEVLTAIEKDLKEAYELLKKDPIHRNGRKIKDSKYIDKESMAYGFRSIRMNYFAVTATLARLNLLKGSKENAYKYAKEVIDAENIFQLLKKDDVNKNDGERDLMFEREIIFGLYDAKLKARLGTFLGYPDENLSNLEVRSDFFTKIYMEEGNGAPSDYRKEHWWKEKGEQMILYKYYRDLSNKDETPYDPLYALLRLSEMYYIASEAKIGVDNNEAIQLLNKVRLARNIEPLNPAQIVNDAQLLEQLVAERRKEFWGEGQMFFTYKRLFIDILKYNGVIPASKDIFVLPIPKDEYEFGNN